MSSNGHTRAFLSGTAGTGKTFTLRKRIEENDKYGVVASTTGISAVNLGTVTINSLLGYFDTASLADSFISGRLTARLAKLSKEYEWLWIDEVSMMGAEQLEILHQSISQLDGYSTLERPIKLGLCGDFCQLSPVKEKWAFQAACWDHFAANTERLTKIWRQSDPKFLEAINLVRAGNGHDGGAILKEIPEVQWTLKADPNFQGTTIIGKNNEVNNFNFIAHNRVQGELHKAASYRWGTQRSEWKNIPDELEAKTGAYVMLLSNSENNSDDGLEYANGDCGYVSEYEEHDIHGGQVPVFVVKLIRTGQEVVINPIERRNTTKFLDDKLNEDDYPELDPDAHFYPPIRRTYFDKRRRHQCYVHGAIEFMPMKLAYATTVHKSQSLSLDNVQLDVRGPFMQQPNLVYVGLSRCRTPGGLTIVGTPELFATRCNVAPEVVQWL